MPKPLSAVESLTSVKDSSSSSSSPLPPFLSAALSLSPLSSTSFSPAALAVLAVDCLAVTVAIGCLTFAAATTAMLPSAVQTDDGFELSEISLTPAAPSIPSAPTAKVVGRENRGGSRASADSVGAATTGAPLATAETPADMPKALCSFSIADDGPLLPLLLLLLFELEFLFTDDAKMLAALLRIPLAPPALPSLAEPPAVGRGAVEEAVATTFPLAIATASASAAALRRRSSNSCGVRASETARGTATAAISGARIAVAAASAYAFTNGATRQRTHKRRRVRASRRSSERVKKEKIKMMKLFRLAAVFSKAVSFVCAAPFSPSGGLLAGVALVLLLLSFLPSVEEEENVQFFCCPFFSVAGLTSSAHGSEDGGGVKRKTALRERETTALLLAFEKEEEEEAVLSSFGDLRTTGPPKPVVEDRRDARADGAEPVSTATTNASKIVAGGRFRSISARITASLSSAKKADRPP